eukprot:scaffold4467_cov65-Phaeocystis_antarctica.AAC.3
MISAVIGQMYSSGTSTASLASDGPAAPLLPPSLSSVIARSNASAFATAARASSRALDAAAARAPTCTAFSAASFRTRSAAATSRALDAAARSAAARLAASAAANCFASRSASCCASSSLSHRAWASAPMPPSRTSRGAAASANSSADSPPTTMAALNAASARSAANAAGLGTAAGSEAGAVADGTSLDSPPGAVGRPALFFFLDFFERACPAVACSAASSASSSSIATSARAVCAVCAVCIACGATCGRVGSAVVVRPWALACRVGRCCGRRCRAARCWPGLAMSVRLKATEAIAPSTTESTTQGQASGTSTAHRSTPRPSERHDACCRRSFAVVEWPWSSACRRAVKPRSSSSSVLALARSRACTHASCPLPAAYIRAVPPSMECRSGLAEC